MGYEKIGIIGAMQSEVDLLLSKMSEKTEREEYGSKYYSGKISGKDVVLVCSSIGKINAALNAQTLISVFGVDAIINSGVAGAAASDLSIYDVVVAKSAVYHDVDHSLYNRYFPFKTEFFCDEFLIEKCVLAIEEIGSQEYKHKIGKTATGDIFVTESAVKEAIIKKVSPDCIEMESAAIAQCCDSAGIPVLAIRSMSDDAEDGAGVPFDAFQQKAADIAATILVSLLAKI